MTQTVLERLSPTNRVLKRAQYEAFAFSLYDGDVLIRNEIRPTILDVATQLQSVADGGVTTESTPTNSEDDTEAEVCDCQYLTVDFPCWECVRTGRRDLPE